MVVGIQEIQLAVTIIKDVSTCLTAITAAVVAVLGLRAWKKQLKGKTEYELARNLLRATYKVRNSFMDARNPTPDYEEIMQALEDAKIENYPELDMESFIHRERAMFNNRSRKIREAFVELDSLSLEAEVIWGSEVRENLRSLTQCASKVNQKIIKYLEMLNYLLNESEEVAGIDVTDVYAWPDDPEEKNFTIEINEAVSQIENYLKPRLRLKI